MIDDNNMQKDGDDDDKEEDKDEENKAEQRRGLYKLKKPHSKFCCGAFLLFLTMNPTIDILL